MLNRYSYKGCMFECRLKQTIDTIGCLPWDYPMPTSPSLDRKKGMCTSSVAQNDTAAMSQLARFDAFMNSAESITNCECPADCEEVVYDTQVI